jgi:hypothetical protein
MSVPAAGEPDDLTTIARPRIDPSPEPAYVLTIIEGPDQGRTFSIDGSQPSGVLVGQSPACEVRLADRHASRRHASLDVAGRRLRLVDLGSTNGTFVDGLAVVEVFLQGGETVRVGEMAIRVERSAARSRPAVSTASRFGRTVGASLEMRRLYPLCERLAAASVPVIIEGETGTGKEVLAESLHQAGPRAHGPFVVFDCTAVPASLVEAELFGHARGAFTGAVTARKGIFEQAHGGTLLIDEIGDLDLALQPKLLRAIERSEVRPIGANRSEQVDVRVLAATRRDLDRDVQAGRFRDDLFHRLAVTRVELPPLRRRRGARQPLLQAARSRPRDHLARGPAALAGRRVAGQRARAAQRGGAPAGARRAGGPRVDGVGRGGAWAPRGRARDACGFGRARARPRAFVSPGAPADDRGVRAAVRGASARSARRQRLQGGRGVRYRTPIPSGAQGQDAAAAASFAASPPPRVIARRSPPPTGRR